MTNTDAADAKRLLDLLKLSDVFSDVVAPAEKPIRTKEHFEYFQRKYNALPEESISFGDNFINEIAPALELGMGAVFLSHLNQNYYSPKLKVVPTLSNLFEQ